MKLLHRCIRPFTLVIFLITLLFSISYGAVHIPFADVVRVFLGSGNDTDQFIILSLRLPRIVEAAMAGAGLSIVGACLQALLRNPMADPYVLGVSSGAAFGATIAIILGLGLFQMSLSAFFFALVTIYMVYTFAKTGFKVSPTAMLLAGIALSTFLTALISLLMLLNHDELSKIVFWTMGSFSLITWTQVYFSAPVILGGSLILYFFTRDINVIMTGEEAAEHLGVDTEAVKKYVLLLSSLITATIVSISGIIGFVGLIIPNISRLLVGPDNRILVPFSALLGATFMVFTDTLARLILAPAEIPSGIITAALGGPFFLYLLIKSKNKAESM